MSDELLQRAIASYTAEPRPGLERRVLQHVYASNRRRRLATFFLLAAAFGVLMMVMRPHQTSLLPEKAKVIHASETPALEPVMRVMVPPKRSPLAKQSVFPTPMALTDGEKALFVLMQQHPETSSQVASRQTTDALEIAPLEVQPLKTDIVQ